MKRMLGFFAVSLLWAATAVADPKTADEWYKEGENQYILGEYDKAAEAFKSGFALETQDSKKPAYIYNVAQSYRQAKKCTEAVFFYKRFLQMKADGMGKPLSDTRRQETEQLITEAETCAKSADSTAAKKPEGTMKPDGSTKTGGGGATTTTGGGGTTTTKTGGGGTTTTGGGGTTTTGGGGTTTTTGGGGTTTTTGGGGTTTAKTGGGGTTTTTGGGGTTTTTGGGGTTTDTHKTDTKVATKTDGNDNDNDDDNDQLTRRHTVEPKLVDARATLGGSHISFGSVDMPMRASFALVGGYPIKINPKLKVYPGAALTFTPIPYKNMQLMNAETTATFTQLLANAGATYEVAPKISARGDIGLGFLFFGGIQDMGNPFTVNEQSTTGTLAMFNFRIAVSGDYEINKNVFVTATPFAFSYSPAKDGLNASSITTINFSVGAGYRM